MEHPSKVLKGSPRPFHGFRQTLGAILLLVLALFSARFCAVRAKTYLQEKADDAALWILQEQTITRGFGLQLIDNQLRFAASFGLGLTDAMIQFENIPYDPKGAFIGLWKGMNPGILVEKIEFLNHAVRITLRSDGYRSLALYCSALRKESYFSNVLMQSWPDGEGQIRAELTCLFA